MNNVLPYIMKKALLLGGGGKAIEIILSINILHLILMYLRKIIH